MKRVFPQESTADSHSLTSNGVQPGALNGSRRVHTSAAVLGIALSFGTSATVLVEPESALAAEGSVVAVLPAAESKAEIARPVFVIQQGDPAATAYHTVQEGDSLWQIAEEHQADVQSIKAANAIAPDEVLRVGQVLRVPSVLDGVEGTSQAGKVQRLALNSNVRGSVGGDLSVVFGEELPSNLQSQDDEALDVLTVAKLEADAVTQRDNETLAEESYELTAAALLEDTEVNSSELAAQPTDVSVSVGTSVDEAANALPTSMPLNEVAANPLEEVSMAAATPESQVSEDMPAPKSAMAEDELSPVETGLAVEPESPSAAWQDQEVQPSSRVASVPVADKPLEVAALGSATDSIGPDSSDSVAATTQVYRVKAGDTFWNIANRHGITPDELIRHNAGQSPEDLRVGDSLSIPTDGAQSVPVSTLARASQLQPEQNREAVIRDHLARIREAANREVDQQELKARINAVRQSLEQTESDVRRGASLEFHGATAEPDAKVDGQAVGGSADSLALVEPQLVSTVSTGGQSDWTVTDAANDRNASELAAVSAPADASEALAEPSAVPSVSADLMAVAPMSPDVYRASPQLPIGETVTPGMPILPDSGEFLPEAPNRFNGYVWPTQGTLTSGYGWRWGRMHRGIDIAGPVGTPVMAAAPGVVVRSGWNSGGYGNLVDIRHADGSMTRYAHNSRLLVREGQQVGQGQQIAEMGSTGYSTGPHLHFEVHLPNTGTVNPLAYLPGR